MGLVIGGVATAPLAATLGSANLLLVWAILVAGATGLAWRLVRREGISLFLRGLGRGVADPISRAALPMS